MSMPAPPGFLSPAAFPFPGVQFPQNDAPFAPGSPYLVARLTGSLSAVTATIHVQNPTNAGDAICVLIGIVNNNIQPSSCTDTKGNVYSLNVNAAVANYGFNAIAVNSIALTATDTITITWPGSVFPIGVVVGCPAASLGSPSWLVPAVTGATVAAVTASYNVTSLAALSQPALLVLMLGANSNSAANLLLQNSSGSGAWNVVATSFNPSDTECMLAAWRIVPRVSVSQVIATALLGGAGFGGMRFTALIPETRFAPNRPAPAMPPGMQSPGAWQYAPLMAPEGPWSTRYNPGPNRWAEALPAVAVSAPALTRSTAKTLAAAPVSHGALAGTAARFRTLATAPHAAAALAKGAGKHLAAAAHPAGKLTRATRKALAATSRAAASLTRASAKRLAARAVSAARLLAYGPAPVFTLGVPRLEWNVSISTIGMSHLSTEYVPVPVAATRNGASYNPTADTVQFAFMPTPTQVPQPGDWIAGSWETAVSSVLYPYSARCLVGPAGNVTLGIGTYIMYVRITDSPEVPVLIAGQLQVS